jgi:hypothetical protein
MARKVSEIIREHTIAKEALQRKDTTPPSKNDKEVKKKNFFQRVLSIFK